MHGKALSTCAGNMANVCSFNGLSWTTGVGSGTCLSQSRAKVAFAKIELSDSTIQPADFVEALSGTLTIARNSGTSVERYNRRWRMGPHHIRSERWLYGRMGFESLTADSSISDQQKKDFLEVRSGQVAPFAIDLERRRVAFELRSATIRPGTFQGNLQALLAKASGWPWRVRLEGLDQEPWEDWRGHVERITKLTINVKLPNPHFAPQDILIEDTFEAGKLGALKLAAKGDDIDPEGPRALTASLPRGR